MRTDETNPFDWLEAGRSRLQSADHLWKAEGPSCSVIELLQEAVDGENSETDSSLDFAKDARKAQSVNQANAYAAPSHHALCT